MPTQARPRVIRIILVESRAVGRATPREMRSWNADLEIADEVANVEAPVAVVRP